MSVQNNPNAISLVNHPVLIQENQLITFKANHSITSEECDRISRLFEERINNITSYINSCKFSGVPHNTGTYIGDIENGLPHGAGRFDHEDFTFIGFWENGNINGYGRIYAKDKNCDGTWNKGICYGVGQIIFAGGLKYVGEIVNYQPNGRGKFYSPISSEYIGDDKNNIAERDEEACSSNGNRNFGEVSENTCHEKGTSVHPNGDEECDGSREKDQLSVTKFQPKKVAIKILLNNIITSK